MYNVFDQWCQSLKDTQKFRQTPDPTAHAGKICFASNDYLGFSRHPELLQAALEAGQIYGVGATGSRLLSGNRALFEDFEQQIARDKGTESALIFATGFQANLGILSCLLDEKVWEAKPLVFFDRLNHASLYQAVQLSQATMIRYRHDQPGQLQSLLEKHHTQDRPKFIISETVFGMDGNFAPLAELRDLAHAFNTFLYLDEAHSTGLFGPQGYGLSTTLDWGSIPLIVMGTFSKALGTAGAYVACAQSVKTYLINRSAGFIYSTAPCPMAIGAAQKAWEILAKPSQASCREDLQRKGKMIRDQLRHFGFNTGTSASHIIPIIVGSEEQACHLGAYLATQGIHVSIVRPPTVPPHTARIRMAVTALHTSQEVDTLLNVLEKASSCFSESRSPYPTA